MKAMVFAAGYGRRLRPKTDKLPKALIPISGRPMIEYSLLLLSHFGIKEVIINLNHLGSKIEEHLGSGENLGLMICTPVNMNLLRAEGDERGAEWPRKL